MKTEDYRKKRVSKLINLGGLMVVADIDSLPRNTLLGLLIESKRLFNDLDNKQKDKLSVLGSKILLDRQNKKKKVYKQVTVEKKNIKKWLI